jgi:hypothetical protein
MRATTRASGARCVCSHRRILATAAASLHSRLRSRVFHSAPSDQCSSPALFHGWVLDSILSNYSTIHPQLTLQMCLTQHLTCTCTFIGFTCTCLCRSLCVTEIGTRRRIYYGGVFGCCTLYWIFAWNLRRVFWVSEFDSGFAQHLCAIVGCHIWMLVFFAQSLTWRQKSRNRLWWELPLFWKLGILWWLHLPYFTTVLSLFCTNTDTRADIHIEISPSLLCILLWWNWRTGFLRPALTHNLCLGLPHPVSVYNVFEINNHMLM